MPARIDRHHVPLIKVACRTSEDCGYSIRADGRRRCENSDVALQRLLAKLA
jgi:hypothetical protein